MGNSQSNQLQIVKADRDRYKNLYNACSGNLNTVTNARNDLQNQYGSCSASLNNIRNDYSTYRYNIDNSIARCNTNIGILTGERDTCNSATSVLQNRYNTDIGVCNSRYEYPIIGLTLYILDLCFLLSIIHNMPTYMSAEENNQMIKKMMLQIYSPLYPVMTQLIMDIDE